MNLKKLFEMQKVLRDRINYNEPDRFDKLILALLVEIGECANEWRGFKFWSKDQKPRTKTYKSKQAPGGEFYRGIYEANPLLEEYVDGLHFILEIGLEIGIEGFEPTKLISFNDEASAGEFNAIYQLVSRLDYGMLLLDNREYKTLFNNYLHLGKLLGFTWEQIEQAYIEKNEINHQRQDSGTY